MAGDTAPTLKQLEEFARKTHTPVGFLFLDTPPAEPVPIPDFRTVGDRPLGVGEVVTASLLDVVYTCQAREEWYRDHQLLNGEDPVAFVSTLTTATPVVAAAAAMGEVLRWDADARAGCRTWSDALTRLRENAEASGVLVMNSGVVGSDTHRKLRPEEFRGFALADDYAPLVFVNGPESKRAQVFTIAHELATSGSASPPSPTSNPPLSAPTRSSAGAIRWPPRCSAPSRCVTAGGVRGRYRWATASPVP